MENIPPPPPSSPQSKIGVHLLPCRDCPAVYTGETGRSFKTRINDHVSACNSKNYTKSAFAKHLLEIGHWGEDGILLHIESNFRRRLAFESIEIEKAKHFYAYDVVNHAVSTDDLINNIISILLPVIIL